ncbi:MAG: Bax inhibitor-1 family protein, partial [Pseudomonadota bacterium]
IGPVISFYLSNFINGHALVISAFGATGAAFLSLTIFGLTTKKDFSFLGPFLFAGIIVSLVLAIAAYVFNLGMLSLAVSGSFALLMSAYIVYETQQIVRGGQRNYILAATSLFISIFSIFSNLLHLFGFFFGEE